LPRDGQEELLRLLLAYEKEHGEKSGWLLIALGLVYLGQLIGLVEARAPAAGAGKATGPGLAEMMSLLGPLMGALKRTAPEAPSRSETPPDPPPAARPEAADIPVPREEPRKNHDVIRWDSRLVSGARRATT